ncbi:hypothetical protein CN093_11410 [Sinorhizobium meliloti]|nr:hypothetical protein CN093_11410 [Sinorhizobium meliloti]
MTGGERSESFRVGTPVGPRPDGLDEASTQGKCESYDQMTGGREVAFFRLKDMDSFFGASDDRRSD